jgi:hypothetical protein
MAEKMTQMLFSRSVRKFFSNDPSIPLGTSTRLLHIPDPNNQCRTRTCAESPPPEKFYLAGNLLLQEMALHVHGMKPLYIYILLVIHILLFIHVLMIEYVKTMTNVFSDSNETGPAESGIPGEKSQESPVSAIRQNSPRQKSRGSIIVLLICSIIPEMYLTFFI